MNQKKIKFYCAFCGSQRKAVLKKNVTLVEVFFSTLAAVLVSLMLWQELDLRLVAIAFIFLAIAETVLQIKWRLAVVCPYCGFDPVLHKHDPSKSAQRIKSHLERRKKDPSVLLSKNAVLNIPRPNKPLPPETKRTTDKNSGSKLDLSL